MATVGHRRCTSQQSGCPGHGAGDAHKEHAQHALDTIVDLLEANDDEPVQVDGSVPPSFGEWRLRGVKKAWFAEMAPIDRQDVAV